MIPQLPVDEGINFRLCLSRSSWKIDLETLSNPSKRCPPILKQLVIGDKDSTGISSVMLGQKKVLQPKCTSPQFVDL